jgi:hypothetical protein
MNGSEGNIKYFSPGVEKYFPKPHAEGKYFPTPGEKYLMFPKHPCVIHFVTPLHPAISFTPMPLPSQDLTSRRLSRFIIHVDTNKYKKSV